MKILFLDIETAPNIAHVWGLWKQNINLNQLVDSSYVMCWSAKWLGSDEVLFNSVHHNPPLKMLQEIHNLLDEADAVVHYNGTRFDIPTLNKEFLLHGIRPPAPYKQIDLLKTARNKFKFPSNKLDYVAQALGVGKKHKHQGHQLWVDCMAGKHDAWQTMETYNKADVELLEKVYGRLRPWIAGHANYSIHGDGDTVCPNCGDKHYHSRGFAYTQTAKYRRFQCLSCGTWFRGGRSVAKGPEEKFVAIQ